MKDSPGASVAMHDAASLIFCAVWLLNINAVSPRHQRAYSPGSSSAAAAASAALSPPRGGGYGSAQIDCGCLFISSGGNPARACNPAQIREPKQSTQCQSSSSE